MKGPTFDVLGFLGEPGHPASVATVTGRGGPALAMMWFLAEDDRLWFHTAETPDLPSPFRRAAREQQDVAVMVRRIYRRYVDGWTPKWERQATSASYHLWSMSPDRGMAVSYPGLNDSPTFRWSESSMAFASRW
jgi:hypothetical protein